VVPVVVQVRPVLEVLQQEEPETKVVILHPKEIMEETESTTETN
jgi:hypothetical protein